MIYALIYKFLVLIKQQCILKYQILIKFKIFRAFAYDISKQAITTS